jgi:citrate lyase subunit beta/citryl-CoA lyase
VILRINAPDTPWFEDDLEMARLSGYSEIMLPKASDPDVVRRIARHLGPQAGIYPIIETVHGAVRMREVASVAGVRRLLFGTVDFSRDSGIQNEDGWLPIRVEMVLASRLAGLPTPIDGTLLGWNDPEALRAQAARSRSLGFGGRLCIHPAQVAPIREGMQPSSDELAWARRVIESVEQARHGAIVVDGKLVDKPVVDLARDWIAQSQG